MGDEQVENHIEQLVAEEHRLWRAESDGTLDEAGHQRLAALRRELDHSLEAHSEGEGLGAAEHQRLEAIKVQLDRYWDLLRQRRARERAGLDPDAASLRDADTVEKYLQ